MHELMRLTPALRARCNSLIKKQCANCDNGNCLLLDDGDEHTCPQTISYSLLCRYFRNAVLPADKKLYADIFNVRTCVCKECSKEFVPASNRQKYCKPCGKRIRQNQKNDSKRKLKGER